MRSRPPLPLILPALLWLASEAALAGESLGDVARREQRRRAAEPPQDVRTITNDDLDAANDHGTVSTLGSEPPAASAAVTADNPDRGEDERSARKAEWRRRFADARQHLKDAETRAWQDVVEMVLVDGGYFVPMRVRKFVETEELRQARQALVDLEDELRRSGGPAGWGRE